MSGGRFNYNQFKIYEIQETIESIVIKNHDDYGYSEATIREFEIAIKLLRKAFIYAQRIDFLISGDDSEETFHKRLAKELQYEALQS
jgi:hypothetical protein